MSMRTNAAGISLALLISAAVPVNLLAEDLRQLPNGLPFPNPTGFASTFSTSGRIDLTKGLIRVGIGVPAAADFELVAVDDPYHFASAAELSLFRRPLPTTNLQFLSTVMWDGRETFGGTDQCNIVAEGGKCFASIHFD